MTVDVNPNVDGIGLSGALQGLVAGAGYSPTGQTIVALGDSLQFNGILIQNSPSFTQNSPLNWTLALLKQVIWQPFGCSASYVSGPADIVNYNLAVGGKTSAQVISEQLPTAITLKAGWWSVLCGTNDLTFLPGDSLITICNRIRLICQAGLNSGAKILLWTLPPRNDSSGVGNWQTFSGVIVAAGSTVVAQRSKSMGINAWIRRYAQETPGIVLADPFNSLSDPASATGDWYAGLSTDAVHHNNAGSFIAAQVAVAALTPYVKPIINSSISQVDVYSALTNPSGNFALTTGMLGTSGTAGTGVTGTVPTGWTIDPQAGSFTATAATQARTDFLAPGILMPGRELQIAVNSTAASSQLRTYQASTGAVIPANVPFYCEMEVSVSASTAAWGGPTLNAFFNAGGQTQFPAAMAPDGSTLPIGATFDAVIRTPLGRCNTTAGGLMFALMNLPTFSATAVATMKVRRISIRTLDPTLPGLLLGAP